MAAAAVVARPPRNGEHGVGVTRYVHKSMEHVVTIQTAIPKATTSASTSHSVADGLRYASLR
jgi:hypothetical protein